MENEQIPGPSISSSTTGINCRDFNQGPHSTFTVNVTGPPTEKKKPDKDGIWFEVQDPVASFHGRVEFLRRFHSSIQEGGVTILSQLKIIGGLGGVGKTETARKYIHQFKHHYENVVWINAETKTSMENSFKRLADQLFSNMKDEIKKKPIEEIMRECYETICKKKSLVVFDNAQFHTDSTFQSDDGIEPFIPKSLEPNWKQPFFLITSRNLDWVSLTPQLLELDMLEEDECMGLMKKELSSTMEVNEEDAKELGRVLGGLPLALTQAVAYIREKCRKKQLSGYTFTLSDYLKEFGQTQKQSLNYLPRDSKTKVTVTTTWSVTLNLMETFDDGESAIWLSQVLSILSPDGVPVFFLRKIVKGKMDQDKFGEAMDILRRYAFVKYWDDQRSVNMHRLVQFIILEQLQRKGELGKLLDFLVGSCCKFFPLCPYKALKLPDVEMTNIQCVVNKLRIVTSKSEFLLFQIQLARVHRGKYEYDQALALLQEVAEKLDQNANKSIQCIIELELALVFNETEKFVECASMLKTAYDLLPNHLEPDDPDVSEMMDERVKACVLAQQGKRQEALELKNKICEKKLRRWRSNNLCLFQSLSDFGNKPDVDTVNQLVNCTVCKRNHKLNLTTWMLGNQGKCFSQRQSYLELNTKICKERFRFWRSSNLNLVQSFTELGIPVFDIVYMMDELLERALKYGTQIQKCEICTEANSIEILEFLAEIHEYEGRKEKALEMYKEWYKEKEKILPADDPSLIQVLAHMVRLNLQIGRSDESEDMRKILYDNLMTIGRPHHPRVLTTMKNFVYYLTNQKMYKDSLDLCTVLCEDGEVVWGQYDCRVLRDMKELSKILQSLDRHEEAVQVLKIVDERKCKDFQQYSPNNVAHTKYLIGHALRKCGKFQEALEIFEVVLKIQEETLIINPYELLIILEDISDTLWSLERFDESISLLQDISDRTPNDLEPRGPVQEKLATLKWLLLQADENKMVSLTSIMKEMQTSSSVNFQLKFKNKTMRDPD